MVATLLAIAAPNGGVIALTAVNNINAGTAFFTTLPAEPPICDPAQSPVPLNIPSRLTLAINFWLRRRVVLFLRLTTMISYRYQNLLDTSLRIVRR